MIGFALEDEDILESAIKYLKFWRQKRIREHDLPSWRAEKMAQKSIYKKYFKSLSSKPFYVDEEVLN